MCDGEGAVCHDSILCSYDTDPHFFSFYSHPYPLFPCPFLLFKDCHVTEGCETLVSMTHTYLMAVPTWLSTSRPVLGFVTHPVSLPVYKGPVCGLAKASCTLFTICESSSSHLFPSWLSSLVHCQVKHWPNYLEPSQNTCCVSSILQSLDTIVPRS